METAFVVDEDGYLDEERFTRLGRAQGDPGTTKVEIYTLETQDPLSGIDFAGRRADRTVPPERWWWYLDVLAHLHQPQATDVAVETARAQA